MHTLLHNPTQNPQSPPFDPKQSRTARVLRCGDARCACGAPPCSCGAGGQCRYRRSYAERSSSEGALVLDTFHLPGDGGGDGGGGAPLGVEVAFGCADSETGEIRRQAADGIVGLGNTANALHRQVVNG